MSTNNELKNETANGTKPVLAEVLAKVDELLKWEYTVRSQTLSNEIRNEAGAAIRVLLEVKKFADGQ
jgi:hypothetical protein